MPEISKTICQQKTRNSLNNLILCRETWPDSKYLSFFYLDFFLLLLFLLLFFIFFAVNPSLLFTCSTWALLLCGGFSCSPAHHLHTSEETSQGMSVQNKWQPKTSPNAPPTPEFSEVTWAGREAQQQLLPLTELHWIYTSISFRSSRIQTLVESIRLTLHITVLWRRTCSTHHSQLVLTEDEHRGIRVFFPPFLPTETKNDPSSAVPSVFQLWSTVPLCKSI